MSGEALTMRLCQWERGSLAETLDSNCFVVDGTRLWARPSGTPLKEETGARFPLGLASGDVAADRCSVTDQGAAGPRQPTGGLRAHAFAESARSSASVSSAAHGIGRLDRRRGFGGHGAGGRP